MQRRKALFLFGTTPSLGRFFSLLGTAFFLVMAIQDFKGIKGWSKETYSSSPSLMLLLDNSYSMTRDGPKFDLAKSLLDALLKGGNLGWASLATVSGDLHFVTPLTIDLPLTRLLLEELRPSSTGSRFPAAFEALVQKFKNSPYPQEILFVSDGEEYPPFQAGEKTTLFNAIRALQELGISLSTVNVETNSSTPLLTEMAEAGKGHYFELSSNTLLSTTSAIEKMLTKGENVTEGHTILYRRYTPIFLLLASLSLLIALRFNPR